MEKLVIVGAGQRCYSAFAEELCKKYNQKYKLVGVCDTNIKRCEYFRDTLDKNIKVYTDFDLMLDELQPAAVLVTTQDC